MKQNEIEQMLERHRMAVFSSQEFRRAVGLSPSSAKFILIRYTQKGIFLQLKARRGLYCRARQLPHPWHLANRLHAPSYISLETALAHYGAIPESVHQVTSVTTRLPKEYQSMDRSFLYQRIKKEAYTGYLPMQVEGVTVLVAEAEKALADTLYFVHLGRKQLNDRLRWDVFNKKKTMAFIKAFGRKNLEEWAAHVIP